MLRRYKTTEAKESAEYIYKLRKRGYTYKEIADQVGKNLQTAMQAYKKECAFREKAFYYPFIEYISVRTENAIRKSMSDEMFLDPEKLTDLQAIRTLLCWPGVNDGVLKDLAEGLEEAGYESFDPEEMMEKAFIRDKRFGPLRQ